MFVLDASAILSGKDLTAMKAYTTPSVLEEVRIGRRSRLLGYMVEANLQVLSPSGQAVEEVRKKMVEINEELSDVDLEVLALTLELDATLLTDDYSMQNLASALSIPFSSVTQKGIRTERKYGYRCSGCGRFLDSGGRCPFCGSPVRRFKL